MIVNGQQMDIDNNTTIQTLLLSLKLQANRIVVEVNGSIIQKQDFETYQLNEDDHIEIISFVGGG